MAPSPAIPASQVRLAPIFHGVTVTGWDELERRLTNLERRDALAAAEKGLRGMATPLLRALRAGINAAPVSAEIKRAARKTLGRNYKKARAGAMRGQKQAKAGFGIGKQPPLDKRAGRKGVGVSRTNIHWFVLGTQDRYTGMAVRRTRLARLTGNALRPTGGKVRYTGRIQPLLVGLAPAALAAAQPAMLEAARQAIDREIIRRAGR